MSDNASVKIIATHNIPGHAVRIQKYTEARGFTFEIVTFPGMVEVKTPHAGLHHDSRWEATDSAMKDAFELGRQQAAQTATEGISDAQMIDFIVNNGTWYDEEQKAQRRAYVQKWDRKDMVNHFISLVNSIGERAETRQTRENEDNERRRKSIN